MKTADDWMLEKGFTTQEQLRSGRVLIGQKRQVTILDANDVKQIQLDAWKQGMTDAAEIALGGSITSPSIAGLILAARDKKETI